MCGLGEKQQGNCTQADVGKSDIPDRTVHFAGIVLNGIFGTGFTGAAGIYESSEGEGAYLRLGWGTGLDVSAGVEGGSSQSLETFRGGGEAACGGLYIGNGCLGGVGSSPKVTTKSAGVAVGPTEVLPMSGHGERTTTIITKPVKRDLGCRERYCPGAVGP